MMNYTPEDFTDIRGPEERPTVPGWYVSGIIQAAIQILNAKKTAPAPIDFDYFDGKKWRARKTGIVFHHQRRYWFGLKEKP